MEPDTLAADDPKQQVYMEKQGDQRETKGRPKGDQGDQRETKGRPKGDQKETKGRPKGDQKETKGRLTPQMSAGSMR